MKTGSQRSTTDSQRAAAQITGATDTSIMISASKNADCVACDLIDQAVLSIDPLRPASSQLVLKRLWLADSTERIASSFLN
jgi:hypothetical protein